MLTHYTIIIGAVPALPARFKIAHFDLKRKRQKQGLPLKECRIRSIDTKDRVLTRVWLEYNVPIKPSGYT